MKQNKKYSSIILVIFIMASVIAIPTMAYTDNSINNIDFSNQPIPIFVTGTNQTDVYNESLPIGVNNSLLYKVAQYNDVLGDTYCFLIPNGNAYSIYCASESQTSYRVSYGSGSYDWHSKLTLTEIDYDTGLYYKSDSYGSVEFSDIQIPIFNSERIAFDSIKDWIDNPPVSSTLHELDLSLKAGTIAFVDISGDDFNSVLLNTTTPTSHSSPYSSNQAIGYANSLPSSQFTVPYSGTSPISWNGHGSKTIFGGYTNWARSMSVNDSNGKYLVIVNPHYPQDTPENQATNGVITVHIDQAVTYKVYSLTGDWENGTIVNNSNGESWTGEYDDTTQTWGTVNDQTGLPGNPTSGNVGGSVKDVKDWLEDIANSISGFFTGAIGAVSNLVSAGSGFFHTLIGLYSWLPVSVMSVLSSALIIVITIGVIKVFL